MTLGFKWQFTMLHQVIKIMDPRLLKVGHFNENPAMLYEGTFLELITDIVLPNRPIIGIYKYEPNDGEVGNWGHESYGYVIDNTLCLYDRKHGVSMRLSAEDRLRRVKYVDENGNHSESDLSDMTVMREEAKAIFDAFGEII